MYHTFIIFLADSEGPVNPDCWAIDVISADMYTYHISDNLISTFQNIFPQYALSLEI
jgi:hypothetical protein